MFLKGVHHKKKERKPRVHSERYYKTIAILNRYSLIFHVFLACGICFLIEWISRHSFLEACYFAVDRNLVFLYNSLLVYASLMLVYLVRRRAVLRTLISCLWLFLGLINGCILAKRVSPFSFTDIKMVGDLFTMQSNYFTATEAVLVIACVGIVVALLVIFWFKGPKFAGKPHRLLGAFMLLGVAFLIPSVTDAAVSNNILTTYFENLAQGYKDYGFVYSFSASVLDRGMSTPEGYSEEAVSAVLAQAQKSSGTQVQQTAESEEVQVQKTAKAETQIQPFADTEKPETQQLSGNTQGQQAGMAEGSAGGAQLIAQEHTRTTAAQTSESGEETETETEEKTESEVQLHTESEEGIPEDEKGEEQEYPNIICILLESFVDPEMITFLETDQDPIPNFHVLYNNYTSGYLEVPVVGAGTANTEFEILTGMGMQFFGLGEYPYKTVLKQTNCESIASDLKTLGYGAHVVHNNGGNFYSRRNAFSMMGFDTFTSKEMMDIRDYTPIGTWPTDDILIGEVEKSLDYTPDKPDFVYTITVEGHGDYPREQILENPDIQVSAATDESMQYAWEYYVNQLHEVDEFIGELIQMLEERDEKTFVVMFGDHLPTMNLTEEDMATGSLFQTKYATWNNFGLEKEDKNMTSYQLLADMTKDLGISNGTMFTFHQNRDSFPLEEDYQKSMELLQYDILYGDHYCYGGGNPYPASDLVMGTQDVIIDKLMETENYCYVIGKNFTKWSKVFINDTRIGTSYLSSNLLRFNKDKLEEGFNRLVVNQMGSSDSIFRTSNSLSFMNQPEMETETETDNDATVRK